MREKIKNLYDNSTLATKIRYSYLLLLIPMILFLLIGFYNFWGENRRYDDLIKSAAVASDFSLDFKKDFDYETYLLIVGNTSIEDSQLDQLLSEANEVVDELDELTDSETNQDRLKGAKMYLTNLDTYKSRIEDNLREGNKYNDNIEIWENDVQIVTSLVRESIFQYIYYEIGDIQQAREEYQQSYMQMMQLFALAFLAIMLLILFLSYFIPLSITRPIRELSKVTDQVAKGDLSVRADIMTGAEVGILGNSMNTMIDQINILLEQIKKEQTSLRKAEFEVLQSQINPHFLYNTLDTIIWLAEADDQKKVVSMVGSLSEFFRASLNQGKEVVTIREELQHVRSYLEIQQVRYQDILDYEIQIPEELEVYLIPKITIQPLVENALYHGIKNKRGKGRIRITGKREADHMTIQVEDNGIGMDEECLEQLRDRIHQDIRKDKDSYGLYNVNARIRLQFGEAYGLSFESIYREGTTVSVLLPCENNITIS